MSSSPEEAPANYLVSLTFMEGENEPTNTNLVTLKALNPFCQVQRDNLSVLGTMWHLRTLFSDGGGGADLVEFPQELDYRRGDYCCS